MYNEREGYREMSWGRIGQCRRNDSGILELLAFDQSLMLIKVVTDYDYYVTAP